MQLKSLAENLPKPSVILIAGARGSGKDVTAHQTARAIHTITRKQILIDLKPEQYALPLYFIEFEGQFYNNSIMLLSDAHLTLYAREWGTDYNKTIDKFITISRHKNVDFIFTTQETTRMDRNIVTAVDAIIWKEPSTLAAEFERPEIRKLVLEANKVFEGKGKKEKWSLAYAVTQSGNHVITDIKLPFYWSEELSKRYGKLEWHTEPEEEKAQVLRIRRS